MTGRALPEAPGTDIAPVAALLADRARAAMLTAMVDGRPLAAGELARVAGVSAATASAHLARLLDGGLVTVIRQGRYRYYRLAGRQVAAAIESLSYLGPPLPVRSLRQSRQAAALAEARTCYDHLAGRAGVALLDALLARGLLTPDAGRSAAGRAAASRSAATSADGAVLPEYEVTGPGEASLAEFGVDTGALRRQRRRFAGACLDWTQRRPHLNGALGAAITARLLELGWLAPGPHRRAVRVTPAGCEGLAAAFGRAAS
jgi:DNA-binding transcriptional ArsR family regulator